MMPFTSLIQFRFGSWGSGVKQSQAPPKKNGLQTKSNIFAASTNPGTMFRRHYERGDLPVVIRHGAKSTLEWNLPIESVNTAKFLPLFIDGIREKVNPYRCVASEGTFQMIDYSADSAILACLGNLVYPLKFALDTHDPATIELALSVIQTLSRKSAEIAAALVPHYKRLLPVLNMFKTRRVTLGNAIETTLMILDETGGPEAFAKIKYIVPTYETCTHAYPMHTSSRHTTALTPSTSVYRPSVDTSPVPVEEGEPMRTQEVNTPAAPRKNLRTTLDLPPIEETQMVSDNGAPAASAVDARLVVSTESVGPAGTVDETPSPVDTSILAGETIIQTSDEFPVRRAASILRLASAVDLLDGEEISHGILHSAREVLAHTPDHPTECIVQDAPEHTSIVDQPDDLGFSESSVSPPTTADLA